MSASHKWQCICCQCLFEWNDDSPIYYCPRNQGGCGKAAKDTKFKLMVYQPDGTYVHTDPVVYAKSSREWIAHRSREIMHTHTMYDNSNMYYYNGGTYEFDSQGNHHKEIIRRYMSEYITTKDISEILNIIKIDSHANREVFEQTKATEICVNNGIYDLISDTFTPHTPNKKFLYKISASYDENADCPIFKQFLSEILYEKDIPLIQEMMGYLLYGSCDFRKSFMFIGKGANGKSVLLDFIIAMLGSKNVSSVPLQKLESNTFASARLFGKAANICDELSKDSLKKLDTFKKLAAGSLVDAEKKGKDGFEFFNKCKLIFATNDPPIMYDNSDANWDRWEFTLFPHQFTKELGNRDPYLRNKLICDSELSGALNFAIEGLKRLLDNEVFSSSQSNEETRTFYNRMSNPLEAFVQDHIEYTGRVEDYVPKDAMNDLVEAYCVGHNIAPPHKYLIGKLLPRIIPGTGKTTPEINGRRVPAWKCIYCDLFDMNEYVLKSEKSIKHDSGTVAEDKNQTNILEMGVQDKDTLHRTDDEWAEM